MDIKDIVLRNLKEVSIKLGFNITDIKVEIPSDSSHGDLTSNIAMQIAKIMGKNPIDVANEIIPLLSKDENIERVEVVNPGFINFFFSEKDEGISKKKKVDGRPNSNLQNK